MSDQTNTAIVCPTCDGWQQVEGRVGGIVDCPSCCPDDACSYCGAVHSDLAKCQPSNGRSAP